MPSQLDPSIYAEHFWKEKGAECAKRGFAVTTALTSDPFTNAAIRAGYAEEIARLNQSDRQGAA